MAATNPVELGFYDTPSYASEVAVAGNYAYVADGEALTIINVADPAICPWRASTLQLDRCKV